MTRRKEAHPRTRRAMANLSFALAAFVFCCSGILVCLTTMARADTPPNPQQVQFAQRTSDLMLATLFGALLQEFAETTPANVEEGKKSISLVFNDRNEDMRLVGVLQPLRANDVPQDSFETTALARAMHGENYTDSIFSSKNEPESGSEAIRRQVSFLSPLKT